jgi:hypothetical protein
MKRIIHTIFIVVCMPTAPLPLFAVGIGAHGSYGYGQYDLTHRSGGGIPTGCCTIIK